MKLLDFYAEWCPPCKTMDPLIEGLIADGANVEKIDIDKNMETAQSYGVMSIPTYVVLDGDKEVQRFTGVTEISALKKAMGL